jgi:hypothetical protein
MREQLVELSRRDPDRKVFGAKQHQYRNTPVEERVLCEIEAELGVQLPAAYRDFLVNVGTGAGPYYGVWGPTEGLAEVRDLAVDYAADKGTQVNPASPFPLTTRDLLGIELRIAADDKAPWAEHDWPCSGCLPICQQGCTFWSVLVLAGEFSGTVWDLNHAVGYTGQWRPAFRPPGWWNIGMPQPRKLPRLASPPTFQEWFAGWVDRCLADLPAGCGRQCPVRDRD